MGKCNTKKMTATSKTMIQVKKKPQDIPETVESPFHFELSYKLVCVSNGKFNISTFLRLHTYAMQA